MPAKQKKTPKERKNETFQRIHDFLMKYKNILVESTLKLSAEREPSSPKPSKSSLNMKVNFHQHSAKIT